MSDVGCGSLILDTIDELRKRKARPDIFRICHMLERRHGLKSTNIKDELAKLVKEGAVIKVDYKGNASYRNAAKWTRTKTQFFGNFYNSPDVPNIVLEAVSALTLPSKDQTQPKSASIHDIEQYLLKRDAQSNLNLSTLRAVLDEEVSKNSIQQLPSGEYLPAKESQSDEIMAEKTSDSSSMIKDLNRLMGVSPRENVSKSQRNRCDYCLLTAASNRKGDPEIVLACKDCTAKAHPTCMEYTELSEKFYRSFEWQCTDCLTCIVCDDFENLNDVLRCCTCLKGYHMNCHEPTISDKPVGAWSCIECDKSAKQYKFVKSYSRPSNISEEKKFETHNVKTSRSETFSKILEKYPAVIPCAQKWSIEDVEAFLSFIGFEDEAKVFRQQEIDGLSLLLMKRNDVLIGLGIRLGPALKIYKHIQRLQTKVYEEAKKI